MQNKPKSTRYSLIVTALLFILLTGCNIGNHGKSDAVIEIDLTQPGKPLSPDLYGIFFEDINHAADGGLYAELIQNRDFEYNRVPEGMKWINDSTIVNAKGWSEKYMKPSGLFGWTPLNEGDAKSNVGIGKNMPLNAANPQSLKLEVLKVKNGRAGVVNNGYWGIPIQKEKNYLLSFYCRKSSGFKGTVKVSIESKTGKVYASKEIGGIQTGWKQYTAKLTVNADDPNARFVISTASAGTLWFDVVSLFPEDTWKNRPNGLRADLAMMLARLKPSFLRFPGGCVVEGATLENRFQWKKTIGDVAKRPGHWNLWGYHSTDGLGFHEYLQLCEDLKAAPMYVINVGMSCQARNGEVASSNKIKDYLNESLDALEYAMGPVTSKWGALRAANGHPAPFKIKYVEIGNENGGPDYQLAYKIIQPAIKKKFPEIITIADQAINPTAADLKKYPGVRLEMVDEHYYQTSDFFYTHSNQYDGYDRKNPWKVYIGEFAVTQGKAGTGNLNAALGEAAFMIGMERNADIVRMASYAPTFVNVHDRKWNPDMIVYNNAQAYGTPSYYAIRLFSENRPDKVMPTSVTMKTTAKAKDSFHLSVYATAGIQEKKGFVIIKMVNPFNDPKVCKVVLNYKQQIKYKGEAYVMTSGSVMDENSFKEPEKVVPMTRELKGLKNTFNYECPAHSVVIIKLRYKKGIAGNGNCC